MDESLRIVVPLLLVLISSALMNAVGLYLLHKDGRRQTNQNVMLKFLSGCELVLSLLSFLRWILTLRGLTADDRIYQIIVHFAHADYFNYIFVMIFMTLDRFIAVKYPLRYPFILSRRKAKMILFSSLVICGAFGFTSLFVNHERFDYVVNLYVFPFTSATAAISIVFIYTYILTKVLRRRHLLASRDNVSARRNKDEQRLLKMVAIINATFMVFFLVPDMMFALWHSVLYNIDRRIIFIIWYSGFLVDPITYIFMQKRLRNLMLEMLRFGRCRRNTNSTRLDSVAVISGNRPRVIETKL